MGVAESPDIMAYHERDQVLEVGCLVSQPRSHQEPSLSSEAADGLPETTSRADTTPEVLEQTDAC